MVAVKVNSRLIRVGDDFVSAIQHPTEHTLTKTVRGIEYTIEIAMPCDKYTAERIVKKLN
jgi:hypothetical protein